MRWRGRHRYGRVELPLDQKQRGDISPERSEPRKRSQEGCASPSCAVWCFSPMRWRGRHRYGRVELPLDRKQRRGNGRAGFARAAGVGLPERSEPAGPQGAERVPPEHGVAAGGSRLSRPMAHAGTHDQREGRAPARPETAWATRVRSCASSSSVGVFLK